MNSIFATQISSSGAVLRETCVECGYQKRLLSQRKETYSNIMNTKNSLMGDEEKLGKVNFILKKRNTKRQEKYW